MDLARSQLVYLWQTNNDVEQIEHIVLLQKQNYHNKIMNRLWPIYFKSKKYCRFRDPVIPHAE